MTKGAEFTEMAEKREEESLQLSEAEIYLQIVKNILNMSDMPLEFRINMLLETIDDKEMLTSIIRLAEEEGVIQNEICSSVIDAIASS